MAERRISTPLVLAAASGMLAVAAVILFGLRGEEPPPEVEHQPRELLTDDSTPEACAESYYDAWRRRRWREATELSVGEAREAVLQKQAADDALAHDERVIAERGWEALASAPLHLNIDQVDIEEDDRFVLRAVAEYELVGQPYRRRVVMNVRGTDDGYRVENMELGEVLTELPPILRGAGP